MDIEKLLNDEIVTELEKIKYIEFGTDDYKQAVDGVTKLVDRALEFKKLEQESQEKEKDRKNDLDFKQTQMEEDRKDRLVRNGIAAAGVILPLGVTIWGALKSWKFEETGTITSTMGRGFVGKLLFKK